MALQTRANFFKVGHTLNTKEIGKTAQLLSSVIGKSIPDTLPVVGQNVFAHGAGIHQHGALAHSSVYEVMSPDMVGWDAERFPLSSQSGRHGLRQRLKVLGHHVSENELSVLYGAFLEIATRQVLVSDEDLQRLMQDVFVH
jgi:2-isopropylmalate synthase